HHLRTRIVLELWISTHRWTPLSLDRCLLVRFLLVVFVLPVFLQTSIFCYQTCTLNRAEFSPPHHRPPSSSSLRSRRLPKRDPHRDPPPSPPTLPLLPLLERSPRNRRPSFWIETLEPSRPPTRLSSMEAHRSTSLLPTGRVRHSIPGHAETFYRRYRHGPLPSHQEVSARRLDRHRWAWSQRRRGRCDPQDQCRGPSCCSCRPPFFHLHPSLPEGRDYIFEHSGNTKKIIFGTHSEKDASVLQGKIEKLGELEVVVEVVVLEM
ncbi:hypothetical protein BDY24DRAFT_392993, partial [Mrakia frigida]|uniref:uncharacterized protein n=1 Tax=Mrakia frigida TaxID=29902 RepID=UPI003FCBF8CD